MKNTYNNSVRFWRKLNTPSDKAARSALDGADALRRTHCPHNPDASLKGLHKHIDIEPPPALAAFVIILGKTMKTINQANEQQMHSKDNLFDIVACKIAEATKEGSSCVQIRLPVGYDEEVVKDIVCYLTAKMYAVTWHHTIDCIEVSWKWADVERMKKRNHMK